MVAVAAAAKEQNQHDDNDQYSHVSLIPFQPGATPPGQRASTYYYGSTPLNKLAAGRCFDDLELIRAPSKERYRSSLHDTVPFWTDAEIKIPARKLILVTQSGNVAWSLHGIIPAGSSIVPVSPYGDV